jgi:hypothetical protein
MNDERTIFIDVRGWWDFRGIKRLKEIENWIEQQNFPCRREGSIVSRKIIFDDPADAANTIFWCEFGKGHE